MFVHDVSGTEQQSEIVPETSLRQEMVTNSKGGRQNVCKVSIFCTEIPVETRVPYFHCIVVSALGFTPLCQETTPTIDVR